MENNKDIGQLLLSIQKEEMCLWKRERTYLFLPFVTTLVRLPHYAGGRCADKLEEYTAVLGNRVSLDSVAGTYCGVLPPNLKQHSHSMQMAPIV